MIPLTNKSLNNIVYFLSRLFRWIVFCFNAEKTASRWLPLEAVFLYVEIINARKPFKVLLVLYLGEK